VITDGSVRDLDAMSPGFFVLAGSVMPSHAYVHLVEFGGTVSIAGMVVSPNDVIHADRHGAVVIPMRSSRRSRKRSICSPVASGHHRGVEAARLLGRPPAPSLSRAGRYPLTRIGPRASRPP